MKLPLLYWELQGAPPTQYQGEVDISKCIEKPVYWIYPADPREPIVLVPKENPDDWPKFKPGVKRKVLEAFAPYTGIGNFRYFESEDGKDCPCALGLIHRVAPLFTSLPPGTAITNMDFPEVKHARQVLFRHKRSEYWMDDVPYKLTLLYICWMNDAQVPLPTIRQFIEEYL